MTYKPYPIANFSTGLDRSLPPWLIPDEAYVDITNAYTRRGTLVKRKGYKPFGQFTQFSTVAEFSINSLTKGTSTTLTIASHGIVDGSFAQLSKFESVNLPYGPTYRLHVIDENSLELQTVTGDSIDSQNAGDLPNGAMLYTCNGISAISFGTETTITFLYPHGLTTGQKVMFLNVQGMTQLNSILLSVEVIDNLNVKLFYIGGQDVDSTEFSPLTGSGAVAVEVDFPIRGFANSFDAQGDELLVVLGDTRICVYNENQQALQPLSFYDTFNSGSQIISSAFNGKLWLASSGMPLQAIDTASLIQSAVYPQYGANSTDIVTEVEGVFNYGGRLILFSPTYVGVDKGIKRQRMLFSAQLAPDNQTVPFGVDDFRVDTPGNGGYVDFDTDESFVGAAAVRGAFMVYFTRSIWRVRETPKSSQPFIIEKVQSLRAAAGPKAMLSYEQTATSLGQEALIATDGSDFQRLDAKIPDWLQNEIDQSDFEKVTAARDEINRQVIWTYPENETFEALVLQEADVSFSRYKFAVGVLGNYLTPDYSPAWINFDGIRLPLDTWNDHEESWDSFELQERVPVVIGGDNFGQIFYLNQGDSDNGMPISMRLETKELNPFLSSGVQSRLGYVDFLVLVDADGEFDVSFFADSAQYPYLTTTVPCIAATGAGRNLKRVVKRVTCNQSANFHTICINQTSLIGSFVLEAIVPHFAQTSAPLNT